MNQYVGKQSIKFVKPPHIISCAAVAGKKENDGPLGGLFDLTDENDSMFGKNTWEEAESYMQEQAVGLAIQKAGLKPEDIRYLIGGDLLGQMIATSFGAEKHDIPFLGVYGACSTMGESMSLAAILTAGGFAKRAAAVTSSHFACAEKEFRFPLSYGNQRALASTWTVTGSGAVVIEAADRDSVEANEAGQQKKRCCSKDKVQAVTSGIGQTEADGQVRTQCLEDSIVKIIGITTGKIVDYGVKDSMNMGACMAPAAADTIQCFLKDFSKKPEDFDRIITGDLGTIGTGILKDILNTNGYDISKQHMDCGNIIYDADTQDTHSGGSGCGCSAVTLCAHILRKMKSGEWKNVVFVPTGALLSKVSFNEGRTVPGIAHAVWLSIE